MKKHSPCAPTSHIPVLLAESVQYLAPIPYGTYVDATCGGGGHTRALLRAEPTCKVIACDWDAQTIELYGKPLTEEFPGRVTLLWANFAQIGLHLKQLGISTVHGLLADFGTSRFQIEGKAGFSCTRDTPLDMRMSPAHQHITAAMIVAQADPRELTYIIGTYGGERYAKAIAETIVEQRKKNTLRTTGDLVRIIESAIPRTREYSRIHPATRTFQALRIVVNKELENIKALLAAARTCIAPEGRLVCISFHSLEDGLVKDEMIGHPTIWQNLTPRIITPSAEEITTNPSARSARLRAAQRL